jgi:putative ABC transport system substrate-binding protein
LAQTKVHRIGVLLATSRKIPATARATQPFIDGLRDLGYVEGRNLVLEWREAEGRIENMPALAAELVASNVDLIVAGADSPATAAMKATASIPIVFVAVSDPVGLGLVKSLARPGTNLTGLASFAEALTGKQLELLREVFPRASRVAVFNTPGDPINASQLAGVRAASAALKMQVRLHDVVSESHLDAVFREIVQDRPDALQVFVTAAIWFHQRRIVEFAAAQRLPAVYANTAYVESGGLMGYSFSYEDLYRRSVAYVDKILKGTSPGVLPVEQPTKLDLALNVKTARALGIAFSHSMLARADRVIE